MGGILATVGKPDDNRLTETIRRMAERSPYRGKLKVESGPGWAIGLQRSTSDDWMVQSNGHAIAFTGYVDPLRLPTDTSEDRTTKSRIAHLIRQSSPDSLIELHGAWAFVHIDLNLRKMTTGKDYIGLRPLFFGNQNSRLVVASEIRQVLSGMNCQPRPNAESLVHLLLRSINLREATPYEGVSRYVGGHYYEHLLSEPTRAPTSTEYWTAPETDLCQKKTRAELTSELLAILQRAVRSAAPDEPFAVWMSGGVDSTSIMALIRAEPSLKPLAKPYSHIYPGFGCDESKTIREVCRLLEVAGTTVDASQILPSQPRHETMDATDGFYGYAGEIDNLMYDSMSTENRKIALSGIGGDEFLRSELFYLSDLVARGHILSALSRAAKAGEGVVDFGRIIRQIIRPFSRIIRQRVSGAPLPEWLGDRGRCIAETTQHEHQREKAKAGCWHRSSFIRTIDYLRSERSLLEQAEQFASKRGGQTRYPLLDREIAEFALSTHPDFFSDKAGSKRLFQSALVDIAPAEVIRLTKKRTYNEIYITDGYRLAYEVTPENWTLCRDHLVSPTAVDNISLHAQNGNQVAANLLYWLHSCEVYSRHVMRNGEPST